METGKKGKGWMKPKTMISTFSHKGIAQVIFVHDEIKIVVLFEKQEDLSIARSNEEHLHVS